MDRHIISIVPFLLLLICSQSCKTSSKIAGTTRNDTIPAGVLSFLTTRDGNFEVYSMTADGKNVTNLTNNKSLDFWSSWSPDGKYILFYSNRDGNNEIYQWTQMGKIK